MMDNRLGPPYLSSADMEAEKGEPLEFGRCEAFSPADGDVAAKREAKYMSAMKANRRNPISAWMAGLYAQNPDHETWLRSHLAYVASGGEQAVMLNNTRFVGGESQLPTQNAEFSTIKAKEKATPKQGFYSALFEYGR